jgi:hypothetical protein
MSITAPTAARPSDERGRFDRDEPRAEKNAEHRAKRCTGRDAERVRRNERVAEQVLVRRACRGQRGADEHCHSHARHPDLPDDRIGRSGIARARQALPNDGGDVRGRKRVAPRSECYDNQHAEHDNRDADHRPRLRRGLARRAQRVDRVHCATPACSSSVRTCASVGARW